jgi:3-oxoadipate enol-lactonase
MRIVFLHGIGGLARGFDAHIAYFAQRGFQAIASNQPGYGGEPLVAPYSFEAAARILHAHLNTQPNEPTVLVGHSMGGMLAQTLAIMNSAFARPLNLVALVLAQTSPAFGNNDGQFQKRFIADRTAPLENGKTMADVAAKLVPSMVGPNCSDLIRSFCADLMAEVPEQTYRAALGALVQFDARPNLAVITLPVLCLGAEYDKTAPALVLEKLASKLPRGHFANLPELGHLAPFENPELFCTTIEHFLQKVPV